MKRWTNLLVSTILPTMGIGILSACQAVEFPEEEYPDVSEHKLTVFTRSANPEFAYPVNVYAFNETGSCVDSQIIKSEGEGLSLHLPKGMFKVVAVSGFPGESLPAKPSLSEVVFLPASNYLDRPVSMGQADVSMGSQAQTLNVMMKHCVSKLSLTLKQVPHSVTNAEVYLSKLYSQINLRGEMSHPQTAVIPCVRRGEDWVTDAVYLLPSESQSVIFSISLSSGETVETFGYVMSGPLEENTPYTVTGTYSGGITLGGSFDEQTWKEDVLAGFVFGPGVDEEPTVPLPPAESMDVADEIPETGSLWEGHVVAHVDETSEGASLLLLSLMEWSDLTSANYEEDPEVARRIAQSYKEGNLNEWHIPTKEEAKKLQSHYAGDAASLNQAMRNAGGVDVSLVNEKRSSVRYLCEAGVYSYSFALNTQIAKAGTKTNSYRLRLVKTVPVQKK